MYCMKCGKETDGVQVFCEDCLNIMALHPVKPGTAVVIPHRPPTTRPDARRKGKTVEEELASLQKMVRRLCFTVIVLLACLCASLTLLVRAQQLVTEQSNMGKNYSTVAPTETT